MPLPFCSLLVPRRGTLAARLPRPRLRRLYLVLVLLALAGSLPAVAPQAHATERRAAAALASLARPVRRCRGSTRAHITITWPTAADLATDRRQLWTAHLPRAIRRWAYLIGPEAAAWDLDPTLVAAVMQVESKGDPLAWNLDSDARGLMQVLHASFQPALNVRLGVAMLGALQRQFGRRDLVLAAYNAGPGNVQRYGGVPPFTETRDYIILVDYDRDLYAGVPLSAARVARFKAAQADLAAFKRRVCGRS